MKIKSVTIKNFRTHRHTRLSFSKGVNVICGLPDSGKTNIVRAIDWVDKNRPLGFKFHSNFTKDKFTKVTINNYGGSSISLKKKGSRGVFTINGEELKAIGTDVPAEVRGVIDLGDLSIHEQGAPPFLVASTPSEVAKKINKITQLEKSDDILQRLNSKINLENRLLRDRKEEYTSNKKRLRSFDRLVVIETILNKAEKLSSSVKKVESEIEGLEEGIVACDQFESTLSQYDNLDMMEKALADVELLRLKYTNLDKNILNLSTLVSTTEYIRLQVQEKVELLEKEKGVFESFLHGLKQCPYCRVCNTPVDKHDLNDLLQEFK